MSSTVFLVACVVFGVGALISIILGAVTGNTAAIVIGVIVLLAAAGMFISGLYDRKHTPRQRRVTT